MQRHLEDKAELREIETIISMDLLELLVLLWSIIMQQYKRQLCYSTPSSRVQTNITSQDLTALTAQLGYTVCWRKYSTIKRLLLATWFKFNWNWKCFAIFHIWTHLLRTHYTEYTSKMVVWFFYSVQRPWVTSLHLMYMPRAWKKKNERTKDNDATMTTFLKY